MSHNKLLPNPPIWPFLGWEQAEKLVWVQGGGTVGKRNCGEVRGHGHSFGSLTEDREGVGEGAGKLGRAGSLASICFVQDCSYTQRALGL